jgi:hypothetical protein
MKFETLQEIKHEITSKKPIRYLSDGEWQEKFKLIKILVSPSVVNKQITGRFTRELGSWNKELNGAYDGATNWMRYCHYINDVLKQIRNGKRDYCYYTYQICDLLRFEHDGLKTKYNLDGKYIEVWLNKAI